MFFSEMLYDVLMCMSHSSMPLGIVIEHCYNHSWYFFLVFREYHREGM